MTIRTHRYTSRRRACRRGFTIVVLLFAVMVGSIMFGLLMRLFTDVIYLQRVAAQHIDRASIMDSLSRKLRRDAFDAASFTWNGRSLTLQPLAADAPTIKYDFEPGAVTRRVDNSESDRWSYVRLKFSARLQHGVNGNLLHVSYHELAPPRVTRLRTTREGISLLLPAEATVDHAETQEAP